MVMQVSGVWRVRGKAVVSQPALAPGRNRRREIGGHATRLNQGPPLTQRSLRSCRCTRRIVCQPQTHERVVRELVALGRPCSAEREGMREGDGSAHSTYPEARCPGGMSCCCGCCVLPFPQPTAHILVKPPAILPPFPPALEHWWAVVIHNATSTYVFDSWEPTGMHGICSPLMQLAMPCNLMQRAMHVVQVCGRCVLGLCK